MGKAQYKNKSHPFFLHEKEEVLWMGEQAGPSFWQILQRAVFTSVLFTVFIAVSAGVKGYFRTSTIVNMGTVITIVAVIALPISILVMFFITYAQTRNRALYMVTNERLFYLDEVGVKTMALENVPPMSVFQGNSSKGSLSFGPLFPSWSDIENAADVKATIETAQAQRAHAAAL